MKRFIGYFDFLGFKDFIFKNSLEEQHTGMDHIFRDIELALSHRKTVDGKFGRIADLSNLKIDCINFSDTVVFWTKDDSLESFKELIQTCYDFNWHQNLFSFPVRGAIFFGDIHHRGFNETSPFEGKYNVNSLYGKGLIDAYLKAENQQWAGTVIDESTLVALTRKGMSIDELLKPFAVKYQVPYKTCSVSNEEYVIRLVKGTIKSEYFKNVQDGIERSFSSYNKDVSDPSVQTKLKNTIEFLKTFIAD
jgi:hypothetical protein